MAHSADKLNRVRCPVANDEHERMIGRKVDDLTQLRGGAYAPDHLLGGRTVLAPKFKIHLHVLAVLTDAEILTLRPLAESPRLRIEHAFQSHANQSLLQALDRFDVEDGNGHVDQSEGHFLQLPVPLTASVRIEELRLQLRQTGQRLGQEDVHQLVLTRVGQLEHAAVRMGQLAQVEDGRRVEESRFLLLLPAQVEG